MTFQPIVPLTGTAGWIFLKNTSERQLASFTSSPVMQRDKQYFVDNISKVATSDDLVNDHRLLKVALGAFGLDDDIQNKYFIKRIIDDGTTDSSALANKLSDSRYKDFAEAFSFSDINTSRFGTSAFTDNITNLFETRQFEIAVGEQNSSLRLAMTIERELEDIASTDSTNETKWLKIMGNPPLKSVFETAFGLPSEFGALDIDRQVSDLKSKASKFFQDDTVSQFGDADTREKLTRIFLAREQLSSFNSATSSQSIALQLLSSSSLF